MLNNSENRFSRLDNFPQRALAILAGIAVAFGSVTVATPSYADDSNGTATTASRFSAPKASAVTDQSIELRWSEPTDTDFDVENYRVNVYAGDAASTDKPVSEHRYDVPADSAAESGDEQLDQLLAPEDELADAELGARISGLAPNTSYRFAVVAEGSDAASEFVESDWTDAVTTTEPEATGVDTDDTATEQQLNAASADIQALDSTAALAAPTTEILSSTAVTVTFPGNGLTYQMYTVRAYSTTGAEPEVVKSVSKNDFPGPSDSLSADVTGLTAGASYTFTFSYLDTDYVTTIESAHTAPVELPLPVYPSAPQAVTATALSGTQVVLGWQAPSSTVPVVRYTVRAYADAALTSPVGSALTAEGSALSATINSLTAQTTYYFAVTAESSDGATASSTSTAVPVTTTGIRLPETPEAPTVSDIQNEQITIDWAAIDSDLPLKAYQVKTYLDDTLVATSPDINPMTAGTTYTASGLLAARSYSFSVTARGYDGDGNESARSVPVTTKAGVAPAPGAVTLSGDPQGVDYWVKAEWTAPEHTGGFPITGYLVEFYQTANNNNNNLLAAVEVPAGQTSYILEDVSYGLSTSILAKVWTLTGAGYDRSVAANSATLSLPTRSSGAVSATTGRVTAAPTVALSTGDPGAVTVTWNAPTTTPAGYLVRITERKPNQYGTSANVLVKTVDVGTATSDGARRTAVIDGLSGSGRYAFAIVAYEYAADGITKLYRQSSPFSSTTQWGLAFANEIPGTRAPFISSDTQPATPVAVDPESLTWTGAALTGFSAGYNPGTSDESPVTALTVYLYQGGASGSPIATKTVSVVDDQTPTITFDGLTAGGVYSVRYEAENKNGTSNLSVPSKPVTLPSEWAAGARQPWLTSLAQLNTALSNKQAVLTQASSTTEFEAGLDATATLPWTATKTSGEVWLYGAHVDGTSFATSFSASGRSATVTLPTSGLSEGTYYAAFFTDIGSTASTHDVVRVVKFTLTKNTVGPTTITDAEFRWGINNESNNGAYFGGCNFLSAGKSADAGGAKVFVQSQYSAQSGTVSIVKPDASGTYVPATWSTKCLDRYGNTLKSGTATGYGENQVVISGGTGIVDPSTNSATITWDGDFTVAYYGGMTFWYVSDPVLQIENGVGTITATVGGFAADMDDLSKWTPLEEEVITLAVLGSSTPVAVTSVGIQSTPQYCGVRIDAVGGRNPQTTTGAATGANCWGSFPQDFVDFQMKTGQSAYWYSSGGTADGAKPALPVTVRWGAALGELPNAGTPDAGSGAVVESPAPVIAPALSEPVIQQIVSTPRISNTSVDSLETLLSLIADGTITEILAADAGVESPIALGDRLDLSFEWPGDSETSGTVWAYPDGVYLGTFRVVDGRVTLALDTSILTTLGENYVVFFGEDGTTVAIAVTIDSAQTASADDLAAGGEVTAAEGVSTEPLETGGFAQIVFFVLLGTATAVTLGAGGTATALLIRRRSRL